MNLLVDIGNSRCKWAMGDHAGCWCRSGTIPLGSMSTGGLEGEWGRFAAPSRVVVSNVAGDDPRRLVAEWSRRRWSLQPDFVVAGKALLGISNGYTAPGDLGSDRWAAMIGAWQLQAGPLCVVDCGTAVTIDAVSGDGEFLGGVIYPGLTMARGALEERTHGIQLVTDRQVDLRCRDTAAGVSTGTLLGLAGAIERLLDEYIEILGPDTAVYLTGGDAELIAPRVRHTLIPLPDLVLRGLAAIAETEP